MLKEAIEYILALKRPEKVSVGDRTYKTISLEPVKDPEPAALEISTLTGLVDYLKKNVDLLQTDKMIITVDDHDTVSVRSILQGVWHQRPVYLRAKADLPKISLDGFIDLEKMNIMLQAMFVQTEEREMVLGVVGNVKEDNVQTIGDNGYSQMVTAKAGVATVTDVKVPNPVHLAPYRTFSEIEQPESMFILRMRQGANNSGPSAGLFEADGGAWRLACIQLIKVYLEKELPGIQVIA